MYKLKECTKFELYRLKDDSPDNSIQKVLLHCLQLKEMADLLKQLDALLKMTMKFDFGNFDDFSIHPTTDYLDALKESCSLNNRFFKKLLVLLRFLR